ncbi:MAG: hypothetical protein AUJ00_02830 [Gemmatimonadetes bacterium 13_1_40CM_3_70_6]|nr:MAG: hypothetical protein AUJ00_02830 [Gemmatimonadetes bacterium 13_1_40CM_3_70_6]
MSPPSRQDVLAEIARRFPSEARTAVVKALNFYGAKPSEPERERVQLAILELSHGDADELRRLVEEAKREPAAAARAAAVPQYEVEGEPAWSYWFIGMCLFIPVFTVGGAIPILVGLGGAAWCRRIAVDSDAPRRRRVIYCAGVVLLCYSLLILVLRGLALV